MSEISLLDCTLRDGAYITDGYFGDNVIKGIILNLVNSNVEMVEAGWLKNGTHKKGSVYYNRVEDIVPYIPKNSSKTKFIAMMDYGRYDISNLSKYDGTSIDTIRLVFPKEKFKEAIEFSKQIKDKGYNLCLQAANTQSYNLDELICLVEKTNEILPDSLSIVDTFGVMYEDDLEKIFKVLDENLDKRVKIGFHSHNNLQLSFCLSICFIKLALKVKRDIIIDSSLCGMGRGAGNTNSELITNYLNQKTNANYDIDLIMDTIDVYMRGFIKKYQWGYSIPFCIAGQLASHVNNIAYLQNTHKTNFKDMKLVLESLAKEERKFYDYDKLEEAYINYMSKEINDKNTIEKLKTVFKGKTILLIAPGKTTITHRQKMSDFIKAKKPLVVGVNSICEEYFYDMLFFSNPVRYKYAKEQNENIFLNTEKIITSNISTKPKEKEKTVNYNSLIKRGWKYFDNSVIMFLRLIEKFEIEKVFLAGFDGFMQDNDLSSYNDTVLQSDLTKEEEKVLNDEITDMLKDFIKKSTIADKINLITPSRFDEVFERG